MASSMKKIHAPCSFLALFLLISISSAQLSPSFYDSSCPGALTTIKSMVLAAVSKERRMGASLLRLHFHDCFVDGCDASVLLDDTATFTGEKTALPNNNSIRGFEVIDSIKSLLESKCPQVVSCADILTVAARDSVVALGGPSWTVGLGRRDSTTANFNGANTDLPSPASDFNNLTSAFSKKGLSTTDMIALSGGHTIGQARCILFRNRIYNETNIDSGFASTRQASCPRTGGDDNLAPLDVSTPNLADNFYYKNLVNKKGLLHSDQVLFNGGPGDSLVQTYANNMARFFTDFAAGMVKMGNISPKTGTAGEIRLNCRKIN